MFRMNTACEGNKGHFRWKVRLAVISSRGFVLISLVDPLKSNYREHGRGHFWLSLVSIYIVCC